MPSATQVGAVIGETLNRAVQTRPARSTDAAARRKMYWWTYRDQDGLRRFAWGCDVRFVAFAGAAFLSFPPKHAIENLQGKRVEQMLEENAGEILNILAQCLNIAGGPHLVLAEMAEPESSGVGTTLELMSPASQDQSNLDVTIEGYGSGRVMMARLRDVPSSPVHQNG